MGNNLLEVKNLTTRFQLDDGVLTAVDNVSFRVKRLTLTVSVLHITISNHT